jgi:hypothetical protein
MFFFFFKLWFVPSKYIISDPSCCCVANRVDSYHFFFNWLYTKNGLYQNVQNTSKLCDSAERRFKCWKETVVISEISHQQNYILQMQVLLECCYILMEIMKSSLFCKIFNLNENNENHRVYPSACGQNLKLN